MNGMNTLLTSAMVSADVTELDDVTELNTDLVTPGVLGFLVIFAIAIALYFLMRSMTGKLKTVNSQKEDERAAQDEENQEENAEEQATDTGDRPEKTEENTPVASGEPDEQTKDTSR